MIRPFLSALLVLLAGSAQAQQIVNLEYAIDADNGFGQNTQVTLTSDDDGEWTFTPTIPTGLALGYHHLYIRTRDDNGQWSHTTRRGFQILEDFATDVVAAEYFWGADGDPGVGNATQINFGSPAPDGTFTFNIPPADVVTGSGKRLYIRALSGPGKGYSHTQWKTFTIVVGTGVEEVAGKPFRLFPNPTAGDVVLSFPQGMPGNQATYTVTDARGAVLQQGAASGAETRINLSYSAGTYFINIRAGEATVSRKVILQ